MAISSRIIRQKTTPVWGAGAGAPGATPGVAGQGQGGASGPAGWVNVQEYLSGNADQAQQMGAAYAGQLENEAKTQAGVAEDYRAKANTYATSPSGPTSERNPAWTTWDEGRQVAYTGGPMVYNDWLAKNPEPPSSVTKSPTATAPGLPPGPAQTLAKIQAAATPAGMAQHFADTAGPNYTVGQGNLDSYLARAGGGGKAVGDLAKKYGTVLDILRYPYPGYPSPTGSGYTRPTGPNPVEGGTYATPEQPQATGTIGNPGSPGSRPGDSRPSNTNKKKRFV